MVLTPHVSTEECRHITLILTSYVVTIYEYWETTVIHGILLFVIFSTVPSFLPLRDCIIVMSRRRIISSILSRDSYSVHEIYIFLYIAPLNFHRTLAGHTTKITWLNCSHVSRVFKLLQYSSFSVPNVIFRGDSRNGGVECRWGRQKSHGYIGARMTRLSRTRVSPY